MKRREFLRSTGWFVVSAAVVGSAAACDDGFGYDGPGQDPEPTTKPAGAYRFPQGVASGDPRETSVVLWTRLEQVNPDYLGTIKIKVQVSTDASFATLVVDRALATTVVSDRTVRVLVTGLTASTTYHYRFVADNDKIAGRTRTAPAASADVQINLAWISCQDYTAGHYGAYRQMIVDDDARPEADRLHAVVFLGDMIYETRADGFQSAIDENFLPIALTNRDGKPRSVGAFPSGGGTRAGSTFARTLEDYRHLYRSFLSDPDIQAARARWPFISVWDDHEFTDDCWQSQANYDRATSTDEGDQQRRVAASQAWFEFVPVHLSGAPGVTGVPSQAHDFVPTKVENARFTAANADNFVDEQNNVQAIDAITIYRSLRFGKHVELVMTDQRSYRSDHAIPEELTNNQAFFAARNALPLPIVNTFDQGKTANGGAPPATVLGFPNARAASPPGTILGKAQKQWWKDTMKKSDATWKLWGSEVSVMRMKVQQAGIPELFADRIVTGDAWDGYPTERNELMGYLKAEQIKNVVVLTGDIHAAFAGVVMDNYDAATPAPVACELVAPGISSNSLFSFFEDATRPAALAALRGLITVDATSMGGAKFTESLNMLLLWGTLSAGAFAQTLNLAVANSVRDPNANGHLRYVDTNSQGYGYVKINGTGVAATLVTINRPIVAPTDAGPGIKRTASFTIPKDDPHGMSAATFTGTKPFPLT
jgi:alkaline phosphatase D